MGSALGDYIHYYTDHYIWFGIEPHWSSQRTVIEQTKNTNEYARIPSANVGSVESVFERHRERLKERYRLSTELNIISADEIWQLKTIIQNLLDPLGTGRTPREQAARQRINELIQDYFHLTIDQFERSFNQKTLKAYSPKDIVNATIGKSYAGKGQYIRVEDFNRKITTAIQNIPLTGAANRNQVIAQLTELKALFNTLRGLYGSSYQNTTNSYSADLIPVWLVNSWSSYSSTIGRQSNFIDQYNQLIKSLQVNASVRSGVAFEMLLTALPEVLNNTTNTAIRSNITQALRTRWVGARPTQITYNQKDFIDGLNLNDIITSGYSKTYTDGILTSMTHRSPDKVDVTFQWNDRDVAISAKNINLHSGKDISLVTQTSLLALLKYQSNGEFANHYLNIVAASGKSSYGKPYSLASGLIQSAHSAMREIIALSAFAGFRDQTANLFILNDTSNTKPNEGVQVYTMYEIYKKLVNDQFQALVINPDIRPRPGTGTFTLENNWEGVTRTPSQSAALKRITNILRQVHQTKISVAVKPSLFQ